MVVFRKKVYFDEKEIYELYQDWKKAHDSLDPKILDCLEMKFIRQKLKRGFVFLDQQLNDYKTYRGKTEEGVAPDVSGLLSSRRDGINCNCHNIEAGRTHALSEADKTKPF
ncbi:MAG: hypothetical protein GY847_01340 [Proteobacteria bacterium]|nr:hypothetical protein [Pseudomonadota bacterium]